MKTNWILLLAMAGPLAAHPNHTESVHNPELDLEKAHRRVRPDNQVEIVETPTHRLVRSNGIPDHKTGRFPNRDNPNTIEPQRHEFRMPLQPQPAARPMPVRGVVFGVALNGVVFDPGTAEFYRNDRRSGWNYEALGGARDLGLDDHHAHVQPDGSYHYHGLPTGLFEKLSGGEQKMTLIGWAADGFPIYGLYGYEHPEDPDSEVVVMRSSYRLKQGEREGRGAPRGEHDGSFTDDYEYVPGAGDLDECNGRHGVTPEFPDGTYYYVLSKDYPFIPRMFRGMPDPSFSKVGMGGGPPGGGNRGGGGMQAGGRGGPPPHPPRR